MTGDGDAWLEDGATGGAGNGGSGSEEAPIGWFFGQQILHIYSY